MMLILSLCSCLVRLLAVCTLKAVMVWIRTLWHCSFLGFVWQEKAPRLVQFQHSTFADSWRRPPVDGQHQCRSVLLSSEGRPVQLLPVHQRRTLLAGCEGECPLNSTCWVFSTLQAPSHLQIPFSKFFLNHRGRVQDNQHPLYLDKVNEKA